MGIALVSVPAPHQSLLSQRPNISSNTWLHGSATTSIRYPSKLTIPHCSSSTSVVEEGLPPPPPPPPPDSLPVQSESATNDTDKLPLRKAFWLDHCGIGTLLRGCKACGREEIENGCNGEGRIQGGIATFPGFGWWPIKAYRPCPGFVASGGRYTRRGQSMDEVAFGRGGRGAAVGTSSEVQSSKKSQGPSKFKR